MRLLWLLLCLVASPAWAGHNEDMPCGAMPALTGGVTSTVHTCTTAVATVPAGATIADAIFSTYKIVTTQLSKATNVTLANITGLSYTLVGGKTYTCHGQIPMTSGASGGAKVALTGDGTLSVTSMNLTATYGATAVNVTSLGTAAGVTAAVTSVILDAVLVVNVGGGFTVQGAQNASNSTATVFLVNGYFNCDRIN